VLEYRLSTQRFWAPKEQLRLQRRADELKCSLELASHIVLLEARITELEKQVRKN
jgi:hypothetical protein